MDQVRQRAASTHRRPLLRVRRGTTNCVGDTAHFNENPAIRHDKGLDSHLQRLHGLFYLNVVIDPLPAGTQLEIKDTPAGRIAVIAPTTLTPTGAERMRGGNTDRWMFNNEGFLVRIHKRLCKALFTPDNTGCPVATEHLDNFRRTIVKRADGQHQDITDAYKNLASREQHRVLPGTAWTGETWFRVNSGSPTEVTDNQTRQQRCQCSNRRRSKQHNRQRQQHGHPARDTSHIQQMYSQQVTTGSVRDTCGKGSTSSHAQHCTCQSVQQMDRTSTTCFQHDEHESSQHSKVKLAQQCTKTTDKQLEISQPTPNGQAPPTSKRRWSARNNLTATMKNNKKHNEQRESKHLSNQHSNRFGNTT